jgi:hypothetical protein
VSVLLENLAMEKEPTSQEVRFVNILKDLDYADYRQQIAAVEAEIADIEETDMLPSERLEVLDELLGATGEEELAMYSGFIFAYDDETDRIADKPKFVSDAELTFGGASFYDIDGQWRVMFDFRDDSTDPQVTYIASFEGMLKLDVLEPAPDNEKLLQTILLHTISSHTLTHDRDFLAADFDKQAELLRSEAIACHEDLLPFFDMKNVSIECVRYYDHVNVEHEKQFTVEMVDQTSHDGDISVVGEVIGVVYLEQHREKRRAFRQASDYVYGEGMPCLVVSSEQANYTSYIPLHAISQVEFNN